MQNLLEIVDFLRKTPMGPNDHDHFTLFAFSTHWMATFKTIDLDSGGGREQVRKLNSFNTAEEAIIDAIHEKLIGSVF